MKNYHRIVFGKSLRAALFAAASLPLIAGTGASAQTSTSEPKKEEAVQLEKFVVTGSFIPQASAEPVGPVAIFTEAEIRATGAFTPIQALRSLPSFVGNPGTTENDSNGGNGSTGVSLRGLGVSQTLVLIDGRVTYQFANIQLLPIEAIDRIEVLRDGAGIIYGSGAIGGAVNVILKKNFTGSVLNVSAGGATRSPGGRETFQGSFVAGAANGGTSVMVSGSYFKNRTIFASQRPNTSNADQRSKGGINSDSPTFPGVISVGGVPMILRPGFPADQTPTPADYVVMDQNGFSSNTLFNFRSLSPSAPGQLRNSLMVNFEQNLIENRLSFFGSFLYSKLTTSNGLAPAPFALDAEPEGPAVSSLTSFGPYNQGILGFNNGDFFRFRSTDIGDRFNDQTFQDYRYQVGLKGSLNENWNWEAAMSVEFEDYRQSDYGVLDLVKLDQEVQAGNFNPFATFESKGTVVINGVSHSWDNPAAEARASLLAHILAPIRNRFYDARINGTLLELPAGELKMAAGYEKVTSDARFEPDELYSTGGVLGLNTFSALRTNLNSESIFLEVKVPLISEKNKIPFVQGLSLGAVGRRESQTVSGLNALTNLEDSRNFKKVNPSINLHYSPTKDYLIRASFSKGFVAPAAGSLFGTAGTSAPTLADPLGFPQTAQTTVVIRTNADLQATESKATSIGFVGTPKDLIKGFSFSVDLYKVSVTGIIANNAAVILAANAAGQGPGFVLGNAATINPNAPFAAQIKRLANGKFNGNGNFGGGNPRGAVLSDSLNIGSREVTGIEYSASYVYNTQDWGRFRFGAGANQFLKFDQNIGAGLPTVSYLGKFVSTIGDAVSPGSIPRWKGNFGVNWSWKNLTTNATFNYVGSYQDDPLFVLSPKMQAFFDAGTPKSDPTFAAFLADNAQPKVGGIRTIASFPTFDLQTAYAFNGDGAFTKGLTVTLGATNLFDRLAPFAAGGFNDGFDTRTVNNIGRFVYLQLRKQF